MSYARNTGGEHLSFAECEIGVLSNQQNAGAAVFGRILNRTIGLPN